MERILVVDDEKLFNEELALFLREKGYEVESAFSGTEALNKLQSFRPHLVLLDIRLPDISGVDVLKHILFTDDSIGVIMITAVCENDVGKRCLELGAFDYITKPLSLDYLEGCVLVDLMLSQ